MILSTLKVELPLLVPRRCPSERFIVNIHVLEIAADLDWVGDGADLLHPIAKLAVFTCNQRPDCSACYGPVCPDGAEIRIIEEVFPRVQAQQWVLSLPMPLRFLCSRDRPSTIGRNQTPSPP